VASPACKYTKKAWIRTGGEARIQAGKIRSWVSRDLEQVADYRDIGDLHHRRVGIPVYRDDVVAGLHADQVLDLARDAAGHIDLGLHGLAGLADLVA
jgi:hypothetical protein